MLRVAVPLPAHTAHAWLIFASSSVSIGVTSSGFSPAATRFCAAPSMRCAARRIPMSSGSESVSSKRCSVRTCLGLGLGLGFGLGLG